MKPPSRVVAPWEANPYRLVSWWSMEVFTAAEFYKIARLLERMNEIGASPKFEDIVVEIPRALGAREIDIPAACRKLGLTMSAAHVNRVNQRLGEYNLLCAEKASDDAKESHWAGTKELIRALQERIQDEMEERLFLYVPPDDAEQFRNSEYWLAKAVLDKWPSLIEDSSESVKCFALSRYTASVFHLMRIMEFGVQKLGNKLGVNLTEGLRWQTILDQANKAIRLLDQKAEETKRLASVSANLYNVKLAWRNEVMHPKATYTKEENSRVLDSVQAFMAELAAVA